ncbi:hypothetical protein HZA33_03375 [Candidatus Pacearchaeota archaeon]|nr:hypothetical protein [Candidatus Pacearchaeota archaeon]
MKSRIARKAQFYIIGAVAIAIILAGLVTLVNYSITKPEPVKFYDLNKQLHYETTNIINYGVLNNQDVNATIKKFIDEQFLPYIKQKDPDIELIYIYGNSSDASVVNYGKEAIFVSGSQISPGGATSTSTVSIDIGGTTAEKTVVQATRYFQPFSMFLAPSRVVNVKIGDKNYDFKLSGQQQFFAILTTKKGKETYVTASEG